MPATLPSPAQMLATADQWQRQAKRKVRERWQPFGELAKKLHADGWKATEAARRCVDAGWVAEEDHSAFYRWLCRQYEILDAGGSLS